MAGPVELRPTIDRGWLEAAAARDPVDHAYALWDLDRFPGTARFVSAVRGDVTIGYLLVWHGLPATPIVHWHGTAPGAEALLRELPPRPAVVIAPVEARDGVLRARGPGREFPELVMLRPADGPFPSPGPAASVRPLAGSDLAELAAWASRETHPETSEYPSLDPGADPVWGAFDGGRLVGVARPAVRLPRVWVIAGVYVEPGARRRGLARGLVGSIVAAAARAGAATGLYVREDRPEARRLYEGLGFRATGRRLWLDLGADLAP